VTKPANRFRYFNSWPEMMRVVVMYVKSLSPRLEDPEVGRSLA